MKTHILTTIFAVALSFMSQAQDKALIKKYLREQLEPTTTFGLAYTSGDFASVPKKKKQVEEPSLQKIDQLHDSLRTNYNPEYLMRIGQMYNRLNMSAKGRTYLEEAVRMYQEKLDKNTKDKDLAFTILILHIELRNFDKALDINAQQLKLYPSDTIYNILPSFIYLNQGDMKKANIEADKAMAKFPGNPSVYLYKTCALVFQELNDLRAAGNFPEAKNNFKDFKSDFSYLDKVPAKVKNNPEVQIAVLSNKFFKTFYRIMLPVMFDPPDSATHFKFKLTARDSTEIVLYEKQFNEFAKRSDFHNQYPTNYSLGVIYMLKNDPDNAVQYFKKSIEAKPLEYRDMQENVVSSYENIIASYLNLEDRVNAEIWLRKKIAEKASVVPVALDYMQLSTLQVLKGDYRSGKESALKALGIDSSLAEAYVALANIYMLEDDLSSAGYYLEAGYQKNTELPALYNSLILFRLLQGNKPEAELVIKALLEYNPENEFALSIKRDFLTN